MNPTQQALAEAAFVADDLRLFLDTHPQDSRALIDYRKATAEVEKRKGELSTAVSALDVGKGGDWDWTRTPWPWEMEG